jgi:putative transposase
MPTAARIVRPGVPCHITQRGNYRQDVFFCDDDRQLYLSLLAQYSEANGLELLGWCLMSNHVHLLAIPHRVDSMAQALQGAHSRYSLNVNARHRRSGHLWQSRFYSSPVGETHLSGVLKYIELNPVRAGMVAYAEDYPWSTAMYHTGEREALPFLSLAAWRKASTGDQWKAVLRGHEFDLDPESVRRALQQGKPVGGSEFVRQMEEVEGRELAVRAKGRPRRRDDSAQGVLWEAAGA